MMKSPVSKTPLLLMTLITITMMMMLHNTDAHITEILLEDDLGGGDGGGGGKTNSLEPVPSEDAIGGECHVEFQVMKRVPGRCVKLGHNSRGCVAGTYLRPFHPECM